MKCTTPREIGAVVMDKAFAPKSYWQRRCEAAEALVAWLQIYTDTDVRHTAYQAWQAVVAEGDDSRG